MQVAGRMVLYARLADFIRTSQGPARRRGVLLEMARTRIGELILRTDPRTAPLPERSTPAARSIGRQWACDLRRCCCSDRSRRARRSRCSGIFDLLFVAYHEGAVSCARAIPGLAVSATRSVIPRSLQSRPMPGSGPGSQS